MVGHFERPTKLAESARPTAVSAMVKPSILLGFPTKLSRRVLQKNSSCILRPTTEVSKDMPKRKPYAPPCVIRHESETEYPEWTRSIVKTLRQQLEAPQFETAPHNVTSVDTTQKH